MKVFLTLALCLYSSTLWAQYPGYGYWTKYEAMQQQQFENQLRLRQQAEAERPQSVLDMAEQATRIRVNKEQERYFRRLNRQMDERPQRQSNPFLDNPFLLNR